MEDKNIATLTGIVSSDVRVAQFGGGKVANVNVEVKDNQGRGLFVPLVGWYDVAEKMESLKQGQRVLVNGRLRWSRQWKNAKGETVPGRLEVEVNNYNLLNGVNDDVTGQAEVESIKFG